MPGRVIGKSLFIAIAMGVGAVATGARAADPAPISDEDAEMFVGVLDWTLASGDGPALGSLMDAEALVAEASRGLRLPEEARQAAIRDARNSLAQAVYGPLNNRTGRVLGVRREQGKTFVVLRSVAPAFELHYFLLELHRTSEGQTLIRDFENLHDSVRTTGVLRRELIPIAIRERGVNPADLTPVEREHVRYLRRLRVYREWCAIGAWDKAFAFLQELPPVLRDEKEFQVAEMEIAGLMSRPDIAHDVLSRVEAAGRMDDPSVLFKRALIHKMLKETEATFAAAEALRAWVGDDAGLTVMLAYAAWDSKDVDRAAALFEQAIAEEPPLWDAHFGQMILAHHRKDYAQVARTIETMEGLGYPMKDILQNESFRDFTMSRDYRELAKKLGW